MRKSPKHQVMYINKIKSKIRQKTSSIGDVMKMLSHLQTDIMQNLGQLANRVEKLENKSKPLNKQSKINNK
jgi:hypothetical protein